jgi:hypothetical protein
MKLRALVVDEIGDPDDELVVDGDHCFDGSRLWVLASDDAPERALGAAVLRAGRHGGAPLTICFDDVEAAGVAARRAAVLRPVPEIRLVEGRSLLPVQPAEAPTPTDAAPPPDGFVDLCLGVGVQPLVEHGIWRGEVLGLEVVRVVNDPELGNQVQVGVGRFDREAGVLLHADQPQGESLAAAADLIRSCRRTGAGAHPLATLCRERWLRHDLVADPSILGLGDLGAVDPADERPNLRDPAPAPAIGRGPDGERVLVVCSVGVDPCVVSAAAELVLRESPDRIVVALPSRDVLPAVERALARLVVPTSILGVACGWDIA